MERPATFKCNIFISIFARGEIQWITGNTNTNLTKYLLALYI